MSFTGQPFLIATSLDNFTYSLNSIVNYNKVVINQGGGLYSNGRYTVKKSGYYSINFDIFLSTGISQPAILVNCNGDKIYAFDNSTDLNIPVYINHTLYLNVDDYTLKLKSIMVV